MRLGRRAVVEGLTEGELALFDLLAREDLTKSDRERLKQASRTLLTRLRDLVAEMGPSQIVYGSDMPFNWPDTIDIIVNAKFLSDAEKEAILGGNLVRLLKI